MNTKFNHPTQPEQKYICLLNKYEDIFDINLGN